MTKGCKVAGSNEHLTSYQGSCFEQRELAVECTCCVASRHLHMSICTLSAGKLGPDELE